MKFLWVFFGFIVIVYGDDGIRHHIDPRILEEDENSSLPTTSETFEPITQTTKIPFNVSILLRNPEANPTNSANISDIPENFPNKTINPAKIDTEVKDLLDNKAVLLSHQHPLEPAEPKENIQFPDKIDVETELIEDGQNTEDELRRGYIDLETENSDRLGDGHLAMILVCSLTALSVVCYAALLYWRRYLENRYGSRTMLVPEEFDDPNDMRHFSI